MLSYFEIVYDSRNQNTCTIKTNYKIKYSRMTHKVMCISIKGPNECNQAQPDLQCGLSA